MNTEGVLMSITSIRLTDDINKPLESLASKLDRSKNYLINQAIKEFLSRQSLEDSRWSDTLVALESIKSGRSLAEADVNAWLNSWGTGERKEPPK
jgi:predicted transcriptional regulator|tara:strand:+ start:1467 stop:1751 length:285 start_codon:yes stop_codon:yes gene_type:complete